MATSHISRNFSANEPSTPECDHRSEHEHSYIECLSMTSTDECHSYSCSGTPPQGAPVPQPVFVNQPDVAVGTGQKVQLRYPVPSVAGQHPQAGYFGLAPVCPGLLLEMFLVWGWVAQ